MVQGSCRNPRATTWAQTAHGSNGCATTRHCARRVVRSPQAVDRSSSSFRCACQGPDRRDDLGEAEVHRSAGSGTARPRRAWCWRASRWPWFGRCLVECRGGVGVSESWPMPHWSTRPSSPFSGYAPTGEPRTATRANTRWPGWWSAEYVVAGWMRTGFMAVRVIAADTATPLPRRGRVIRRGTSTSARIIVWRLLDHLRNSMINYSRNQTYAGLRDIHPSSPLEPPVHSPG
jgi:hypothetical protein